MSRPQTSAPRGLLAAAIAALLLAAGGAEIAMAEGADEPIRLEYRAGPGCPDEAAFVARVRARTTRARLVGAGERARTFTVRLEASARPSGSVTVVDGLRSDGTRRVDADTCDEVADALALIVALAVDPQALSPPIIPPSASAPPVLLDSGAPPERSSALSADSSAPPPSPAPSRASDPSVPPTKAAGAAVQSGSAPLGLHFFGGIDLAIAAGVTPATLVAGAPYVGWRSTSASLIGPSLRAGFLRAGTGTLSAPGGSASFTFTVGRLDVCGLVWPDRALRVGGCARIESGILEASGEQIVGARTQHSPWVAGGPLARVEWTFLGALVLDVEAGPLFRLISNRFDFFPATIVYQVPVVGLAAEAGLGVHFL